MGYKKQICSAGAFLLLSAVLICAVLRIPDTPAAGAPASDTENTSVSEPAAVLTLSNIQPYVPPAMETTEGPVSDLVGTLASCTCEDGRQVVFYRARGGDIYGAYYRDADTLVRFTQEYCVKDAYGNPWGYQDGHELHLYEDVFGHDGFRIVCLRGADYLADDYYYFDGNGSLKLLAQCSNTVYQTDVNGDGEKELLYFPGGLPISAYYFYQRSDVLYEANLNEFLRAGEPDWQKIGASSDYSSGALEMSYSLAGNPVRHFARLSVAKTAVSVYETGEIQLPGLPVCSKAEITGAGVAPVRIAAFDEETMRSLCGFDYGLRLAQTTEQMNQKNCWRITFHMPEGLRRDTLEAVVPVPESGERVSSGLRTGNTGQVFPESGVGNSVAGASPEQIRAFQAKAADLMKDAVPIIGYGAVTDPFSGEKGPMCFADLDETLCSAPWNPAVGCNLV